MIGQVTQPDHPRRSTQDFTVIDVSGLVLFIGLLCILAYWQTRRG